MGNAEQALPLLQQAAQLKLKTTDIPLPQTLLPLLLNDGVLPPLSLGQAYYALHKYSEALPWFQQAVGVQLPDVLPPFLLALVEPEPAPSAKIWLGLDFFALRRFDEARMSLQQGIDLKPEGEDVPAALLALGYVNLREGHAAEAIVDCRMCFARAAKMDIPGQVFCQSILTQAFYASGQPSAALAAAREALRLDANAPAAHLAHGVSLLAAQQFAGAEEELQQALHLATQKNPAGNAVVAAVDGDATLEADLHYYLALVAEARGAHDQAQQELHTLQRLDNVRANSLQQTLQHHGELLAHIADWRHALVDIRAYNSQQHLLAAGSGVYVTLAQPGGAITGVLTCRHLFAGAARAELQAAGGAVATTTNVLAEDQASDIILLAATLTPAATPVPLATAIPAAATPVVCIPATGAIEENTLFHARIPAFGALDYFTDAASPAPDGSPVFTTTGELVGLTVLSLQDGDSAMQLVMPAARILAMKVAAVRQLSDCLADLHNPWLTSPAGLLAQTRGWLALQHYPLALKTLDQLAAAPGADSVTTQFYRGYAHFELHAPKDPKSVFIVTSLNRDDYQLAVTELSALVKETPNFAEAHAYLGLAYTALGQDDNAKQELLIAQQLAPASAIVHRIQGDIAFFKARYDESIAELTTAVQLDAGDTIAWGLLGWANQNLDRNDQAQGSITESHTARPTLAKRTDESWADQYQPHALSGSLHLPFTSQ